jgi:HlyD family secretion protein
MFRFGTLRFRAGYLGLALTFLSLFILARYRSSKAESQPPLPPAPTLPTVNADARHTLRLSGSIAALNAVSLTAPRILGSRSGVNRGGDGGGGGGGDFNLVLLSLAKAGTRVKEGDVVAQFDPQNQMQRLDDYRDTVVQMENRLKSGTAALDSTVEAQAQSVRSAKADWDKAKLDVQTAPVLTEIDVEKLKLSAAQAEETYQELDRQTASVRESQRAQLRILEFNLEQARMEQRRAEANVQKMTIHSPIPGFVVMASIVRNGEYGQVREGDQIFAGQPFVSIVDPSSMVLNAVLNQVDAERLRLGMKATVRLDAYPGVDFPGAVSGIGAMSVTSTFRANFVGEVPVRIRIQGQDPRLLPDLTGSAEIALDGR